MVLVERQKPQRFTQKVELEYKTLTYKPSLITQTGAAETYLELLVETLQLH